MNFLGSGVRNVGWTQGIANPQIPLQVSGNPGGTVITRWGPAQAPPSLLPPAPPETPPASPPAGDPTQRQGTGAPRVRASVKLEDAYLGILQAGGPEATGASRSRTGSARLLTDEWPSFGSFQDFQSFMQEILRRMEEARRQRPPASPPPNPPPRPSPQRGNLEFAAHGYYEGDQWQPVREIRAWEIGNYRNRTSRQWDSDWYNPEYRMRWENLYPNKWYRVRVTWPKDVRYYDLPADNSWAGRTRAYTIYH